MSCNSSRADSHWDLGRNLRRSSHERRVLRNLAGVPVTEHRKSLLSLSSSDELELYDQATRIISIG